MLKESTQGFLLGVAAALAGVLVYACASALLAQARIRPAPETMAEAGAPIVAHLDARRQ